ncbi:MAG TPA: heat-inducible transcriptional repressor HrcA [Acidimicrobiia bacterium]|jgi:heat-inducible transcriptional repressor|nr:heat-inducible transcriptional repressor HrcA [Acidimicrobiia bacterium]
MLDERKSEVLRALVEEHIRTGEPVSSQAILDLTRLNVSAATIRNDVAALERDGFVVKPHTSAGRIPTSLAYRYYVDHCTPLRLRTSTRTKIAGFFSSFHHGLGELLKETTDLLSDITHYPSVVIGPGLGGETIHGVHLVQIAGQLVLVVLVTDSGRVKQELVRLAEPVEPKDVARAEQLMAELIENTSLADATLSAERLSKDWSAPVAELVKGVLDAAARSEDVTREVYVGGTSQMASIWEDLAKVHRVLELLERETLVLSILTNVPEGTGIQIGGELPVNDDVDISVVSTTYQVGGRAGGSVGVIGPMRMDYRRVISAVEEVRENLEESLGSS